MPYGSPVEPRIYCVVMLLTSPVVEKDFFTNTSMYGVFDSKSSMDVLEEIILMMDKIVVISWDMQLLHELFSTGIQINLLLYTYPIILFYEYNSCLFV